MYQRTAQSLPPKNEILAVIHKVPGRGGEQFDDEAIWNGEYWIRCRDNAQVDKNYYYLWRRIET